MLKIRTSALALAATLAFGCHEQRPERPITEPSPPVTAPAREASRPPPPVASMSAASAGSEDDAYPPAEAGCAVAARLDPHPRETLSCH